jgi:Glycosyl transferase family 2
VSGSPEVAVIVGAFHRREYVARAVRSVAAQTIGKDRLELVVTKNFRDAALDTELEGLGATLLLDDEPRIGRWLSHAFHRTTAPIVTLLDDDDEFEPDRLERILGCWREHPDLGFYRNRVRVIDADGRPVPPARWRVHETDSALDATGPVLVPVEKKHDLLELGMRRTSATFNSSTMAIHRDLLAGDVGAAFEETWLPDLFLFLAGVVAPRSVYLDDARLTRFRFYGANVTGSVGWLARASSSQQEMSVLAARHGLPEFAENLARESDHYQRMFLGGTLMRRIGEEAPRAEVARLAGNYLKFLGRHAAERRLTVDTWAAGGYGLAYAVAPAVARRLSSARPTAPRSPSD